MSIRSTGAAIVAILALGASPAWAAKPVTEAQYDAATLKASMVKYFKKTPSLSTLVIGKVTCVLPKNGATFHCIAYSSSAKFQENVVFHVAATLEDNDATTVTWKMTSHTCTDSKTHKPITPC